MKEFCLNYSIGNQKTFLPVFKTVFANNLKEAVAKLKNELEQEHKENIVWWKKTSGQDLVEVYPENLPCERCKNNIAKNLKPDWLRSWD